jgi:rubrerythrin
MAAALMAAEEGASDQIYNLAGGIMAWDGKTLPDFPRVQIFGEVDDPAAALWAAMDLEKGALRFYQAALDRFGDGPAADVLSELAKAERVHARTVYTFWGKTQTDPLEFDPLFDGLKGEILEGGRSFEEAMDALEGIETDGFLRLMEVALDIEYAAYDLYRVMVERFESEDAKNAFTAIAQAEKGHMRKIVEAIGRFSTSNRMGS